MGDLGTGRGRNGGKTGPRVASLFRVGHVLGWPLSSSPMLPVFEESLSQPPQIKWWLSQEIPILVMGGTALGHTNILCIKKENQVDFCSPSSFGKSLSYL